MRLIFDKERNFLNQELNITIPEKKAFMNRMCIKVIDSDYKWHILYRICVKNEILFLIKNNEKEIKLKKLLNWNELIKYNQEKLLKLEKDALNKILYYKNKYPDYIYTILVSGGKDSAITNFLVDKVISNKEIIFSNTTNETHYTYKYIKTNYPTAKIITPDEGFYPFITRTGFVPTRFSRACCTETKEMPMIRKLDKDSKRIFFIGIRKSESLKRSVYTEIWKNKRWKSRDWLGILPILEWNDLDVILYMLFRDIPFNDIYKFGFARCGCTFCCYRSDYELLLNKVFLKSYYDRWINILTTDFINNKKQPSLNCTLLEYQKGAWKGGIVRDTATNDIIKEFADTQKLDINLATKYFDKKCSCCDKKLKKNDIAINLKYYGRNIVEFKCISCVAADFNIQQKQIKEKIKDFKNSDCALF